MQPAKNRRIRAMLVDIDYRVKSGFTQIILLMKGKGRMFRLYDKYEPYFYLDALTERIPSLLAVVARDSADSRKTARATRIEPVKKILNGTEKELLKVICTYPYEVPILRSAFGKYPAYEHRILFTRRYLIDHELVPLKTAVLELDAKRYIKRVVSVGDEFIPFKTVSFDIETYNPMGAPRIDKDPVIMVSYAFDNEKDNESGMLTFRECGKKSFVQVKKNEKEMIESFSWLIAGADLLVGYNSTLFDIPYLTERSKAIGAHFYLGRDKKPPKVQKRGNRTKIRLAGRVHIDVYPILRFLSTIGAVKLSRYTLEEAYREIIGSQKLMVKRLAIHAMWDDDSERAKLAEYSRMDSTAVLEIFRKILPIEIEISRVTKTPLSDASISLAGQLVEFELMNASQEANAIIPNIPSAEEVAERTRNPIQGAYVKIPVPGLYENIAVFDFRGLYPSIIISHNVDPYTRNCSCCGQNEVHLSPTGARFCKKHDGLVPKTLRRLIERRNKVKDEMKKAQGEEKELLSARNQVLKILNNSFYGYLAYPRSRWYSRECGESVTAWGRKYIQDTIAKAEKEGFNVLYSDTDSIMLVLGSKTEKDALDFMKNINKALPDTMELELEGFFPRGVFVSKKGKDAKGARKKYALINKEGKIKIRGFELVRRDWSAIAKQTQIAVLDAILKEGSKEKAVKMVQDTIKRLEEGKVPLEELVIYTQITKDPKRYEIMSPELSAAKKAIQRGVPLQKGSVIGFVITKNGKSISEKAEPIEFAKDYDPGYYIDHQIVPSVLKILEELNVTEDELKGKGKQKNLGDYF